MKVPITIDMEIVVDVKTEEEAQEIAYRYQELIDALTSGRFVAYQNYRGQTVVLNSGEESLGDAAPD
jgi:hypothetical protein